MSREWLSDQDDIKFNGIQPEEQEKIPGNVVK